MNKETLCFKCITKNFKKKNHNGVKLGKSYRYTSIQAADSTINMKSNELRVIIHFSKKKTLFTNQSKLLGSKDLGTNVFRTLMCNVGKPWSKQVG